MNILLQLKHWQLFLLFFVLPFGVQIVLMGTTINREDPAMLLSFFPYVVIYYVAGLFSWFWSMGHLLHSKLPDTVQMNLKLFRGFVIFPVIYIATLISVVSWFIGQMLENGQPGIENLPSPFILLVVIPAHFFAIFCMFYCFYFLSKSLKAVELQRDVSFGDYIGELVLIWIWPVGVWFIQPKINKIYEESAV